MNEFDTWNEIKKEIDANARKTNPIFRTKEIWYCAIGKNVGREENGKNEKFERPVLVLRKYSKEFFLGLPLTSQYKELPFYFLLDYRETSSVLLSHSKTLDAGRLIRKIRTVTNEEFEKIKNAYRNLI